MRRDRLYNKAGGGVDCGGGRTPVKPPPATAAKPAIGRKEKDRNSSFSGCMSGFFNMFDSQSQQFGFRQSSFVSESTVTRYQNDRFDVEGIEPPRRSLQSPESAMAVADRPASEVKEQTNLNVPVGRIKTNQSRFTDELSSDYSSTTPGTKTPNLVARLMGLDLLPEYSSPRPSSSYAPANTHTRSHSLPATPRLSTASRRSTDHDYHHRLSLQIDKENRKSCRKTSLHRSEIFVDQHDSDQKRQYAKVITNQVREKISRRLGTDITNTISVSSANSRFAQNEKMNSRLTQNEKMNSRFAQNENSVMIRTNELTRLSRSPKLRLLDINNSFNKPILNSQSSIKITKPKSKTSNSGVKDEKIKRIERYDLRLKKMHPQEELFVGKKQLVYGLNVKNTTKVISFKKDMTSSASLTPARSCKVQVSFPTSMKNSSYKRYDARNLNQITIPSSSAANIGPFPDQLCKMVKNFPTTSCNIRKDVDELIKNDICRSTLRLSAMAVEAIVDDIVKEIERQVVGNLVEEIVTDMMVVIAERWRSLKSNIS